MTEERSDWLVLTFGDDGQYRGNVGYDDELVSIYSYDSNVANSRNVREGDVLVICDHSAARGIAVIERIDAREGQKMLRRCPQCRTTGIKRRKTLQPLYRCNRKHEFDVPSEELVDVILFTAEYDGTFSPINPPIDRKTAASFAAMPSAQLSIRELDLRRFWPLLAPRLRDHDRPASSPDEWIKTITRTADTHGDAPEVREARTMIQEFAGRAHGRGFLRSSEARIALERYAMRLADAYYRGAGWEVTDVSRFQPFDLRCTRPEEEELRVEVKATRGDGSTVLLTPNEVEHSRSNQPRVELFIVSNLELDDTPEGELHVRGGKAFRIPMWVAEEENLTALGYSYRVLPIGREVVEESH